MFNQYKNHRKKYGSKRRKAVKDYLLPKCKPGATVCGGVSSKNLLMPFYE